MLLIFNKLEQVFLLKTESEKTMQVDSVTPKWPVQGVLLPSVQLHKYPKNRKWIKA